MQGTQHTEIVNPEIVNPEIVNPEIVKPKGLATDPDSSSASFDSVASEASGSTSGISDNDSSGETSSIKALKDFPQRDEAKEEIAKVILEKSSPDYPVASCFQAGIVAACKQDGALDTVFPLQESISRTLDFIELNSNSEEWSTIMRTFSEGLLSSVSLVELNKENLEEEQMNLEEEQIKQKFQEANQIFSVLANRVYNLIFEENGDFKPSIMQLIKPYEDCYYDPENINDPRKAGFKLEMFMLFYSSLCTGFVSTQISDQKVKEVWQQAINIFSKMEISQDQKDGKFCLSIVLKVAAAYSEQQRTDPFKKTIWPSLLIGKEHALRGITRKKVPPNANEAPKPIATEFKKAAEVKEEKSNVLSTYKQKALILSPLLLASACLVAASLVCDATVLGIPLGIALKVAAGACLLISVAMTAYVANNEEKCQKMLKNALVFDPNVRAEVSKPVEVGSERSPA